MRLLKFSTLAIAALALAASTARADDFTFSFSTGSEYAFYYPTPVPGTVTGIIYGLTNNSTGPASDVVITSFPSALDSIFAAGPIDTSTWDQQFENSFTETAGVITAADFWAQDTIEGFAEGAQLYINGEVGFNFVNVDGTDTHYVWGDDGFANVTFAPLSVSTTPEPSSLILLATGLAGAAGSIRRRFRK